MKYWHCWNVLYIALSTYFKKDTVFGPPELLLLSRFSRVRLCNPIDGSPPGSPVPGILQARTLEWVAISFSNAWKWKVKVKSPSRDPMDCSLPGSSIHLSYMTPKPLYFCSPCSFQWISWRAIKFMFWILNFLHSTFDKCNLKIYNSIHFFSKWLHERWDN